MRTKYKIDNLIWVIICGLIFICIEIPLLFTIAEAVNLNKMESKLEIRSGEKTKAEIEIDKENNIFKVVRTVTPDCKKKKKKEKELYNKACKLRDALKINVKTQVGSYSSWNYNFSDSIGKYHSFIYDRDYTIISLKSEEDDKYICLYKNESTSDSSVDLYLNDFSCINAFKNGESGKRILKYNDILDVVNRIMEHEQIR